MGTLLKIAWRNVGRGWRRSVIVIAAIAIGLSASVFLVAWTKGMSFQMGDNAIRTQLGHVVIQAEGYFANPDLSNTISNTSDGAGARLVALAEQFPGVAAAPRISGSGLAQTARKAVRVALVGVDPLAEAGVSIVPHSIVEGSFLARSRSRLPPIVVGYKMAERLQVGIGDKLVLRVAGEAGLGAYRVRGIYRTSSTAFDEVFAFVTLADAQTLFDRPDRITEVTLALDDPDAIPAVMAWLAERVPSGLEILSWRERAPRVAAMIDVSSQMGIVLYGVVFVAMAFGIANVLLMAVYERMREFGVLRSIGLGPKRVIWMVLLEAVLLSLVGTAIGLALSLVGVFWLAEVGLDMSFWSSALEGYGIGSVIYPRVEPNDIVLPLVLAVATALGAAFWPAWKASRLQPAEALRR